MSSNRGTEGERLKAIGKSSAVCRLMTDNAAIIPNVIHTTPTAIDPDANILTRDWINRLNDRAYTGQTNWPWSTHPSWSTALFLFSRITHCARDSSPFFDRRWRIWLEKLTLFFRYEMVFKLTFHFLKNDLKKLMIREGNFR